MRRMALAVVVLCWIETASGRADTLPLFDGIPSSYTPGTPFTFDVRVPALIGFASYTADLIFTTNVDSPPLTVSATTSSSSYPFPSTTNFQTSSFPFNNQVVLLFSDKTSPSVNVTPGSNDTLITVTVNPDASLTGPITIAIGDDAIFSYNIELGRYPPPQPVMVSQSEGGGSNPVPAPSGALLALIGAGALMARRATARTQIDGSFCS